MSIYDQALIALTLASVALILVVIIRPDITAARGGKILAFLAMFVIPVVVTWIGTSSHIEHSKATSFCLSCHEMEPYGQSLLIADGDYLPAGHYQNIRIRREEACYTCHTTYTMFGDFRAKMNGVQHVFVHYLGTVPDKIELYNPYSNRECLHCHEGARSFESFEDHVEFRTEISSGEVSCLECHVDVHDVSSLADLEMWESTTP